MAYKVLIVDDEKNIREGLKTLINWEQLGYKVIGEAKNGEEAFKLIDQLRPQLVIVDIKMPIMDGLTLIEKVTLRHINTRFIILSGLSEFKHAKKAMSLGVTQYVLKPIDAKVLEEKLLEESSNVEKQVQIRYARREKILKDLVMQGQVTGEQWNDVYEEPMPWRQYQVLVASVISDDSDSDLVFDRLYHLLKPDAYGFMIANDMVFLLKDKVYGQVTLHLDHMIEKIKADTGASIRMILGGKYPSSDLVHQSYLDVINIQKNQFLYEDKAVLSTYQKKETVLVEDVHFKPFISKMVHAISFKEMSQLNDLMESYLTQQENSGVGEEAIIANYMHLYVSILKELDRSDEMSYDDFELLVRQKNLQRLHGLVKLKVIELVDKEEVEALKNPVERIRWMIEREYNKELKLEDIAGELGYNSAYIGKQFKKVVGSTFNQYLDKVRLQKAKSMLKTSDYKIYEIADLVGYSSSDYFTLKFRKYEGMSPKEYRSNTKK